MSAQASAWAWSVALDPVEVEGAKVTGATQRLVLVAIADHAWSDGSHAWPGVERLAAMTSLTERSVQRALRALETGGMIAVERAATPRLPTMYRLCVPVDNPSSGVPPWHPRGATTTPRGATVAPEPIVNPVSLDERASTSSPVDTERARNGLPHPDDCPGGCEGTGWVHVSGRTVTPCRVDP